jgi:hypothetical protein
MIYTRHSFNGSESFDENDLDPSYYYSTQMPLIEQKKNTNGYRPLLTNTDIYIHNSRNHQEKQMSLISPIRVKVFFKH